LTFANLPRRRQASDSKQHNGVQFLHDSLLDIEASSYARVNDAEHCRHPVADTPLHQDFDGQFNPNLNSEVAPVLMAELVFLLNLVA
jgi:hypothetical protein